MPIWPETRRKRPLTQVAMALALPWMLAAPAAADEPEQPDAHLAVHGYLSQAYAAAWNHQFLGIPPGGTSDYRTTALQFRYAVTSKDSLVVQLSHERLGRSPARNGRGDVELDWAFYERRFGSSFALKAGKVQIPFGVYNEIRDVGTLLPFYRPSDDFYGETSFTNETVNGVVLSKTFRAGLPWSVDADVYYGEWDYLQQDLATRARVKNAVGGEAWLQTPVDGLRVGVGGWRGSISGILYVPPDFKESRNIWHASLDGDFKRVRLTGEYSRARFKLGGHEGYTAYAGVKVVERLRVSLETSGQHLELRASPQRRVNRNLSRDHAVGLAFSFRPDLVAKLEHHWNKGLGAEDVAQNPYSSPALKMNYVIVSLSASF